jgi:hypothetical protein
MGIVRALPPTPLPPQLLTHAHTHTRIKRETLRGGGRGLSLTLSVLQVDDLRPQLNQAYEMDQMLTPNLDKLSKGATVFHRAYCQMAVVS